jgi:hypothetical protein
MNNSQPWGVMGCGLFHQNAIESTNIFLGAVEYVGHPSF